MSEKRFILKIDRTLEIIDKKENHRIRDMYKSCEMLNELAKENEQLRKRVEKLQSILHIVECCDKNE